MKSNVTSQSRAAASAPCCHVCRVLNFGRCGSTWHIMRPFGFFSWSHLLIVMWSSSDIHTCHLHYFEISWISLKLERMNNYPHSWISLKGWIIILIFCLVPLVSRLTKNENKTNVWIKEKKGKKVKKYVVILTKIHRIMGMTTICMAWVIWSSPPSSSRERIVGRQCTHIGQLVKMINKSWNLDYPVLQSLHFKWLLAVAAVYDVAT
jgi:hypothetical protein